MRTRRFASIFAWKAVAALVLALPLASPALALWKKSDTQAAQKLLTLHADMLADWRALSERSASATTTAAWTPRTAWWLKQMGYEQGPVSCKKPSER